MSLCHSIELIGFEIQVYWQNNCSVLITKDQSSKVCEYFSISWLLLIFYLTCQVRASKNMRCALHWRSPRVQYYKFQKSPARFGFTTSKECSGQISQTSAEFWYPINSFIWLNNAWSFSRSLLQFSLAELKKTGNSYVFPEIYIYLPFQRYIVCHVNGVHTNFFPEDKGGHPQRSRVTLRKHRSTKQFVLIFKNVDLLRLLAVTAI